MASRSGTGWTSPAIIVAALAIASNAGWAYVEISRTNTRELTQTLRDHDRDIVALKTQIELLLRERGGRDGGSR